MSCHAKALLYIAILVLTRSVGAQAPALTTTAFDGAYVGTATLTLSHGVVGCYSIRMVDMMITGGQVVIHEIHLDGAGPTYRGSINAAGEVSASYQSKGYAFSAVSGTVHEKVFTGQRLNGTGVFGCQYSFALQKAPVAMTAFDGTYAGISRTSEATAEPTGGCVPNGPPPPLTIVSGIARTLWGRPAQAEGYVSPEGILFMRAPNGYGFDGRIDDKGTITGRFARAGGACSYQMVYQKKDN
jgi:hypothetical protein